MTLLKTSDFDYDLPRERIAQAPLPRRDASRLLLLDRATKRIAHRGFRDLPDLLRAGDLLVLNDTKVLPARLFGNKIRGGGRVELLLLEEISTNHWRALAQARSKIRVGDKIYVGQASPPVQANLLRFDETQECFEVEFTGVSNLRDLLAQIGLPPLPPYVERAPRAEDFQRYQTIYAKTAGAVAAPTAGLHFTPEIFAALDARGIQRAFLTLHVGLGTFRPVKTERVEDHKMHAEHFTIPAETLAAIAKAKTENHRVVAVGTTVVRALESSSSSFSSSSSHPFRGSSSLFIHPPFQFRVVDALLTNFHLPRSTLLILVCAFAGREFVLEAYCAAIAERYRFYSYGDCMLIL